MQSVQIISQTLDHIFESGGNILYDKYITSRLPKHLNQSQMTSIKQICGQQFTQAEIARPILSDSQPNNIPRDSFAAKQIIKKINTLVKSPIKNDLSKSNNKNRVKTNGRYSTRPTTAGKSLNSTFTKMKFVPTESKFIKLFEDEFIDVEYQQFQNQMRKHKKFQIQKMKELQQKKKVDDINKKKTSQLFYEEYNSLKQKDIKTTFQFDGNILAVTGRPQNRKVPPVLDCIIKQPKKLNNRSRALTTTQKSTKSKISEKHSTELSQKNVFTSLIYQMHSTKNSSKLQNRFYKNDQYNNNNIRQTSHANFIKLNEGVSLYEPTNMVNLSNIGNPQRQFLQTKTATFKHFLLNNKSSESQNSLEVKNNEQYDQQNAYQSNKKDPAETRTFLGSKESSRFRSTLGNKFSSFNRPMTADSLEHKTKVVPKPKVSKNNGTEKIIVSQNMLNVMMD